MRSERGFTLVEIMVTMVIFTLIGLASYTVLDQMSRTKSLSEESSERIEQLQFTWLLIQQDMRQAVPKPTRPDGLEVAQQLITNDERMIESQSGVLGFVRSGYDNPGLKLPRSELQPVVYRVQDNVLQRMTYPYVNDRSGEPVVQDLLAGVKSFQVRFYRSSQQSQSNQGIEAGWRNSWETPDDFPAAIELTIDSEDYGEIRRRFLTGVEPAQTVKKEDDNNA